MANRFQNRKNENFFDYTLLIVVVFLALFGIIMIYSSSSYLSGTEYLFRQILAASVGFAGMVTIIFLRPYHFYGSFSLIALGGSIALVFLLLTPLGITANGATRWLNLGPFSMQPAEACKLGIILYLAVMLDKLGKRASEPKFVLFFIIAPVAFVFGVILIVSRNMSSALIVVFIAIAMLFVSTPKLRPYVVGTVIVIAVVVIAIVVIDKQGTAGGFRGMRVLAWLHPEQYADSTAYQTVQALYAIGSGGITGKGLGQGMQKLGYIPEAQNDMIFSIICEELGLFGAIVVITLFAVLIWRCMIIARNANDKFGALLVVGVLAHIAVQVILNIAVVTNTIPNTGISLPFISYGGTSVVFLFAEIGLVLNVARNIELKEIVRK